MKKICLGLGLASLLLSHAALARKPHVSGRGESCHKPHEFKLKDCRQTFVARSLADLQSYEQQRLQTGEEKKLILKGEFAPRDLLIESDCEVRLEPKTILRVEKSLTLYTPELKIQEGVTLQASDLYVQTEKEFKLNPQSKITFKRAIFESSEKIELENKVALAGELLILNAPKCEIHKNATLTTIKKIGSCFNLPKAQVVLEATPVSGQVPFSVSFSAAKSFGFIDEFTFNFGTGDTFKTNLQEAVYLYESVGNFSATLTANGLTSTPVLIEAKKPPYDNFAISYGITRVNPPQVIMSVDKIPNFEGGIKEYQWGFGDNSSLVVPFAFDNFGGINHDYAQDGIYTLSLRLKGQNDLVTAPVEQVIDTRNTSLPSPNYRISSFKGEAPFTVEVEALETVDPEGDALRYYWVFTDTGEEIPVGSQKKVQHTFTRAGVFRIFLYALDSKEGQRSISIPIYVGSQNSLPSLPPYAIVDSTNRFGMAPLTVDFTAARSFDPDGPTGQPISYQWTFFDSGLNQSITRFGANLTYTFTKPGTYFPLLTVTDVTGQQSSFRVPIFVDGNTQSAENFTITALNQLRTFQFSTASFTNGNDYVVDSFRWDLGDGTYRTGPSFSKTYAQAGFYTVKLQARKIDGPYEQFSRTLEVRDQVFIESAFIQPGQTKFNTGEPVSFRATLTNDLSTPETTVFKWSFGDGTTLKGRGVDFQNVTHVYSGAADYQVSLTLEFAAGTTAQASYLIQRNQPPIMGDLKIYGLPAVAPVRLGFAPYESISDSDGYITQYIYEWGDGSQPLISTNGYEEHSYESAGSYNVKVTVIDNFGARASTTKIVSVSQNQAPIADFDILIYESIAPGFVGIEAYKKSYDVDGWIVQYEYDFGSGEKIYSESGYQDHTYSEAGTYTVKLRAQDNRGLWSELVQKNVTILPNQIPVAKLRFYLIDTLVPGKVHVDGYIDSKDNDGNLVQYEFTFGDGTKITSANAYQEHDYPAAGTYTITLRVQDNKGAWSLPVSQDIVVNANQSPIAGLSIYKLDEVAPGKIGVEAWKLSSDSDGRITLYEFSYGDGSSESNANGYAEHIYQTAGTYTVTVRAQDEQGAWSLPASESVTIKENQVPVAKLTLTSNRDFAPVNLRLSAEESFDRDGNITSYKFDLGNGQVFETTEPFYETILSNGGDYTFKLTVKDNKGAESTSQISARFIQNAIPVMSLNILSGGVSYFTGEKVQASAFGSIDPDGEIQLYQWDWGDGTISYGLFSDHAYASQGTYLVKLTGVDNRGQQSSATQFVSISNNTPPIADFSLNPAQPKRYEIITLDGNLSTDEFGPIVSYEWYVDDKLVGKLPKIPIYFTDIETHSIKLKVKDVVGLESEKIINLVIDENSQTLPVAIITVGENDGKIYGPRLFNAADSIATISSIVSYRWDFGDGRIDTSGAEVIHQYAENGNYHVELTVTDAEGRSSTTFKDLKYKALGESSEAGSDAVINLAGLDKTRFNPINPNIEFSIIGDSYKEGAAELSINGTPQSIKRISPTKYTGVIQLQDGENTLEFSHFDSAGDRVYFKETYYAGSKTLRVNLGANDSYQIEMTPLEKTDFKIYYTASGSAANISNIPASMDHFILVKGSQNLLGYHFIQPSDNEITIALNPLASTSQTENIELKNGLDGWESTGTGFALVNDGSKNKYSVSLNSNGEALTKHSSVYHGDFKFLEHKFRAVDTNPNTYALALIRNGNGEVQYTVAKLKAGIQTSGEWIKDIEVSGVKLSDGESFEVQSLIWNKSFVQASIFNRMWNAYAQGTSTPSGGFSEVSNFYAEFFSLLDRNLMDDGEPQYIGTKSISAGAYRYFVGATSEIQTVLPKIWPTFRIIKNSSIRILGMVLTDESGSVYGTYVPSISTTNNCASLEIICEPSTLDNSFFEWVDSNQSLMQFIPDFVDVRLVFADSTKLTSLGMATEELLRNYSRYNFLNTIKSKNKFATFKPYPLSGKRFGNVTTKDIYDGGDAWYRKSFEKVLLSMKDKIIVNDISNAHGGDTSDHIEHDNGMDFDIILPHHLVFSSKEIFLSKRVGSVVTAYSENLIEYNPKIAKQLSNAFEGLDRDYISKILFSVHRTIDSKKSFYKTFDGALLEEPEELLSSYADPLIVRPGGFSKMNDDFIDHKSRLCLNGKLASEVFENEDEGGHLDHLHLGMKDTGKTLDLSRIDSPSLENVLISEVNGRVVYDILMKASNTLRYELVYDDGKSYYPIYTNGTRKQYCSDASVRAYHEDDCANYEKLTFTEIATNKLQISIDKDDFALKADMFANLYVRILNTDGDLCREKTLPISKCFNNGKPVIGKIHANGGGFVANGASVDEEAFIGEGASICPGVVIDKDVEVMGDVKVEGNVEITGCVSVLGYDYEGIEVWQPRRISGFGNKGIKIRNDCSKPEDRTTIYAINLILEGDINITQPVEIKETMIMKGHKNQDTSGYGIDVTGSCDRKMLLYQFYNFKEGSVEGPVTLSNCFYGLGFTKIKDSKIIGPVISQPPNLLSEYYAGIYFYSNGGQEIVESELTGHLDVSGSIKIEKSKIDAPTFAFRTSELFGQQSYQAIKTSIVGPTISNANISCVSSFDLGPCGVRNVQGGSISGTSFMCDDIVLASALANQSFCGGVTKRMSVCDYNQVEQVKCGAEP